MTFVSKPTRWGEVYIINCIGAPACAYLSNSVGGYPAGYLLTLESSKRKLGLPAQATMTKDAVQLTNHSAAGLGPDQ